MFCSYIVAMTVAPLFCSRFIKHSHHERSHEAATHQDPIPEHMQRASRKRNVFAGVVFQFNRAFGWLQNKYDSWLRTCLRRPVFTVVATVVFVALSFALFPFVGRAYFPRTDPGQFVINIKAPTGTRIELADRYVARVEQDIRDVVAPGDLNMIVSNIGVTPDLSAIYTTNSGMHTAFVQVSLKENHSLSSFA